MGRLNSRSTHKRIFTMSRNVLLGRLLTTERIHTDNTRGWHDSGHNAAERHDMAGKENTDNVSDSARLT